MKKDVSEISYELERIVEKKIKAETKSNASFAQSNTIFDRARIKKDMFFDVMHLLLYMYGGEGSADFMDNYYEIRGVDMDEIPNFQEIFEEFLALLKI